MRFAEFLQSFLRLFELGVIQTPGDSGLDLDRGKNVGMSGDIACSSVSLGGKSLFAYFSVQTRKLMALLIGELSDGGVLMPACAKASLNGPITFPLAVLSCIGS